MPTGIRLMVSSPSVARIGTTAGNSRVNGLKSGSHFSMIRLHPLAAFALCLTVLAAVGCDSVPLTSPTGSTITMTSDRSVLPLNGVATLRAVVIESAGTPVQNGTSVTFSSTLGSVEPFEAKTVNGIATATFNAGGVSGKTAITAFSGGAKTTAATEITIGAAAAKTIALSATP